jgi:hypothetical protein
MEVEGEENLENLWEGCINKKAFDSIAKESYLVMLGDHGSGK